MMRQFPRILGIATATPSRRYDQDAVLAFLQDNMLGKQWRQHPDLVARGAEYERLFVASRVEHRHSAIDLPSYYRQRRSTGKRMETYREAAYDLGKMALGQCLASGTAALDARAITDFFVISCTGYTAPGLDILLARDLEMSPATRRVSIGHMGCFGALVGLRQSVAAVQANTDSIAAMLCVELSSLHFSPIEDLANLTSFALFGDGAAALTIGFDATGQGPEIVATYCFADFAAAEQMSWKITDQGFVMGLSPRVPVTLRRHAREAVAQLLEPHGLSATDIRHWLIHPGGPSILEAIQQRLELSDEQMALSWQILRDNGNCSSATVLLILDELLRSGVPQQGEWGVMMAFGPGLTLETCLLRF